MRVSDSIVRELRRIARLPAFVASAVALAALACACESKVDLAAVGAFADTATSATAGFDSLSRDYLGTCQRGALFEQLQKREVSCDNARLVSQGWGRVNAAWLAYFHALSDLAHGDGKTDFGFTQIAGDIQKNTTLAALIPSSAVVATSLQDFATVFFASRRREEIARSSVAAAALVENVSRAQLALAEEYRLRLGNERSRTINYYSVLDQGRRNLNVEKNEKVDLAALDAKDEAALSYETTVAASQEANRKLVQDVQEHDLPAVASTAKAYVVVFQTDIAPLLKAFK